MRRVMGLWLIHLQDILVRVFYILTGGWIYDWYQRRRNSMRSIIMCIVLIAGLSGCAKQKHERTAQYGPEGNITAKTCITEATSFFNLTEIEALSAQIGCGDEQTTNIGVQGLSRQGDRNMVEGISEGITRGVLSGMNPAAGLTN